MHLAADQQLGPYRIKFLIGKGGMGEVYRASDTVLKREVALKVLPAEFARDPDHAARFQREAQLLASLNHPHIATLHGLEQSDGMTALVMELVDGPTLAERIGQGPIPPPEAFEIARQIAEALEYAHERGVIHRDLKPANVKLTPDDKVKLLDFGLAKALEDDAGPAASQDSPTLTLGHTRAGVILGTAGYMAPEQVMGKRADRRADIWAFGVVLYEMLTGKRLFTGENTAEILASVVKDQPPLEGVPVGVRPMLARCLEKDRRRRLQAIGEARIQIEDGFPEAAPTAAPAAIPPRPRWAKRGPWAALAGMGVLAAGAIGFVHFREAQPELHRVQFEIVPPGALQSDPVLSPDGRHVAFVARGPNRATGLWVRSLDSIAARVFPGTEVAAPLAPFWSPDSRSLGFVSGVDGTLKRIDIAGGAPQTICSLRGGVAAFLGGTWSLDGTIIFAAGQSLWRVPQAGGTPAPLTKVTEGQQVEPHFMPDGKHFVYRERASVSVGSTIYLTALDNQQRTRLATGDSIGASVAYSPPLTKGDSGHLLFIRGATLMAQAMDPKTYALSGEPFSVADQVDGISVSNNGGLAYRSRNAGGNVQLMWFDREGKFLGTVGPPGQYNELALSPDGRRVAVTRPDSAGANLDLWMVDIKRGVASPFTSDPAMDRDPVWSPDGRTWPSPRTASRA